MEEELVKMSPKGQLVVPRGIRAKENFKPSDRFVAFGVKGGVVFKRVNIPNVKAEFESLSKEIAKQFKKQKVREKDVNEAVKWARQK
jgi:bifunctional DNA-binding transcriptional regulator/antitoxin component of YhaV-PrlF toxin-antitoxin module